MISTISYLTTVKLGFGALSVLPDELARLGIRKPLIVTDRGVVASGLLDRLKAALPRGGAGVPTFDGTPANPTEAACEAAAKQFNAEGCDGIVALGGGSSMDLAKGAALLATHPAPLGQYAASNKGGDRIEPSVAPVVAIPTTAGTGSEVGRGAVIIMKDGRKLGVVSPHLFPKSAICDPELTLGLPRGLTAATGLDALAHCVETYCSPLINPPAEAIALDGIERIMEHLPRAVADGLDREARWNMMTAAMEGAMAFQKGLGAVHSLSHALGALPGRSLHHGTLNAVLMPAVMRANTDAIGPKKMARLRRALGLADNADVPAYFAALNRKLEIPTGLGAMGVTEGDFDIVASQAMLDHCHATNPRALEIPEYVAILKEAF
jgi:4-hydroxybutyrate dehydrogenase